MTVSPTNQAKHTVTPTNQGKLGGHAIVPGNPIGLLLALTYANFVGTLPSDQAKHTVTPTNQTKH